jgi:subtilisin family serine protease
MGTRLSSFMILLPALLLTPAVSRLEEPRPVPRPVEERKLDGFRDLADAGKRGAIDRELIKQLEGGKPVSAFAVLEGTDVLEAYGDGGKRGVAAAGMLVEKLRAGVQDEVGVEVEQAYGVVPLLLVQIRDPEQAVRLLNSKLVLSIAANNQNEAWLAESLPLIRQPQVSAGGLKGAGVSVAVLDTGLDFGRFAFGSCTAPAAPATCRVSRALDTAPDDGMRDDSTLHGTNVAGIVAGVAPDAKLISIDVFNGTLASDNDIVAGLDWVLQNRASQNIRAVNLSLGLRKNWNTSACDDGFFWRSPYLYPFTLLRGAGVVPVVAAGNDAFLDGTFQDGVSAPACTTGAFAVGATYDSGPNTMAWPDATDPRLDCSDTNVPVDAPVCWSQDGPQVDVLAPGVRITAAGLTKSGTSMAAPHVAGAVAVLASANPYASTQQLEGYLTTSATTVVDPRSFRSHPRLDLFAAVRAAFPVANDNQAAATPITSWGGRYAQTTWTATREPGEPQHAGNAGGASVWFRWTAARSGTATFSTEGSDFDTLLGVYRTAPNGGLTTVASCDDIVGSTTSKVQFPVNAGDVVLIAVDGRQLTPTTAASGHLVLTVNLPNDNVVGALSISPGAPQTGANIEATREAGEPIHCGDAYAAKSVWYRWNPSTTTTATVRASGSPMYCVEVYEGSTGAFPGFSLLTSLGSASDDQGQPAEVSFAATPSRSYWIAVDGVSYETNCNPTTGVCWYGTTQGSFTLTLTG